MLALLAMSVLVGALSGLVLVVPIEAWLLGAGSLSGAGVWAVSFASALGMALGKLPWYALGRWSTGWGWMQRQMERPGVAASYEKALALAERHPGWGQALMLASAVIGVPPLAVFVVVAGQLRMSVLWTLVTMTAGRTLRFAATLGGVVWLLDLLR